MRGELARRGVGRGRHRMRPLLAAIIRSLASRSSTTSSVRLRHETRPQPHLVRDGHLWLAVRIRAEISSVVPNLGFGVASMKTRCLSRGCRICPFFYSSIGVCLAQVGFPKLGEDCPIWGRALSPSHPRAHLPAGLPTSLLGFAVFFFEPLPPLPSRRPRPLLGRRDGEGGRGGPFCRAGAEV